MAGLPAHCPQCGLTFISNAISVGPNATVTMINNRTNCPNCGGMANFLDGVFTSTGDILKVVRGPMFTKQVMARFAELMERAAQEKTEFEIVKSEADSIDPRLGAAIEKLRGKPHWFVTFVFLMLFTALKNSHFDIKHTGNVDYNQLFYQATHHGEIWEPKPPSSPTVGPYNVLARPQNESDVEKQKTGSSTHSTSENPQSEGQGPNKRD